MEKNPFDTNYIGKKYGLITIFKYVGLKKGRKIVIGRCECGVEKEYILSNLTRCTTKSCGCERVNFCANNFSTHNLSRHPLYRVFKGIKRRCYDKNNDHYSYYGGRGVAVCDLWLNDFKSFYDWCMENGWRKGLQIDKDIIPKSIGIPANIYSPEMCSIVSVKENCDSRSNGRIFTIDNVNYTLLQLSKKYHIGYKALFARISLGWDIKTAVETPLFKIRKIPKICK